MTLKIKQVTERVVQTNAQSNGCFAPVASFQHDCCFVNSGLATSLMLGE